MPKQVTSKQAAEAVKLLSAFFAQGTETEGSEAVKLPTLAELKKMKAAAKKKIATEVLGMEDADDDEVVTTTLNVLAAIAEDSEVEADDVKTALSALGLKPSKNAEKNVEALKEFVTNLSESAESDDDADDDADEADEDVDEVEAEEADDEDEESEESDDDDADESDDDESDDEDEDEAEETEESDDDESEDDESEDDDADEAEESDDEESDEDDEDEDDEDGEDEDAEESEESELSPAAKKKIQAAVKKTKPEDQIKRLAAFNKAAESSDVETIEVNKKNPSEAYAKLLERMIDSSGELAEWGKAYDKNDQGYCCGLELESVKTKPAKKGEDAPVRGKCVVTKAVFEWDGEQFSEVE